MYCSTHEQNQYKFDNKNNELHLNYIFTFCTRFILYIRILSRHYIKTYILNVLISELVIEVMTIANFFYQ